MVYMLLHLFYQEIFQKVISAFVLVPEFKEK